MSSQSFKIWLREKWEEHCDELDAWEHRKPDYGLSEYFNKYKYWLKREYRHQTSNARTGNLSEQ